MKRILTLVAIAGAMVASSAAFAYDGHNCKEAGNCCLLYTSRCV